MFLQCQKLVLGILNNPMRYTDYNGGWSLQGFGMLRLYLDKAKVTRLHVWTTDAQDVVKDVTRIHTHPWNYTSHVLCGKIKNTRFKIWDSNVDLPQPQMKSPLHRGYEVKIKCGEDAKEITDPLAVTLIEQPPEFLSQGSHYEQAFSEIHLSVPEHGAVTLVDRNCVTECPHDEAYVYVGADDKGKPLSWVDAKPRPATKEEILRICYAGYVNLRNEVERHDKELQDSYIE